MTWGSKELNPNIYEYQTHYYFQNSRHLLAGARSRKKTKRFLTTGWENYGDATWCDCGVLERFNALNIPLNTWAWCWRGCPWASAWSAKPGHKSRFRKYSACIPRTWLHNTSTLLSTWFENARGEIDLWQIWGKKNMTLGADKERLKAS